MAFHAIGAARTIGMILEDAESAKGFIISKTGKRY
jgi:hypothetical protein